MLVVYLRAMPNTYPRKSLCRCHLVILPINSRQCSLHRHNAFPPLYIYSCFTKGPRLFLQLYMYMQFEYTRTRDVVFISQFAQFVKKRPAIIRWMALLKE